MPKTDAPSPSWYEEPPDPCGYPDDDEPHSHRCPTCGKTWECCGFNCRKVDELDCDECQERYEQ